MDSKSLNQVLLEQSKLLTDATSTIKDVLLNLYGFLSELSQFHRQNIEKMKDFEFHSNKISEYIDHVHLEIPALMNVIKGSEKQAEEYQNKIEDLNVELKQQKDLAEESRKKHEEIIDEVNQQSSYAAVMGATLGKMIWKTSKSQEAIETYIQTGTLNQFLNVANISLLSFMNTYNDDLPPTDSYEINFMLSIFGIYTNVVAQRVGRDFVLERDIGISFVNTTLSYLGKLKMPSGQLLKRLFLMLIYNVSITKRGAMLIEISENGIENIVECFDTRHTVEIQSIAISLITSLLNELPTYEFCERITEKLSQNENDLKMLMNSDDENIKNLCKKVVDKIRELNDEIDNDDGFSLMDH